jgi:hypothetical protein
VVTIGFPSAATNARNPTPKRGEAKGRILLVLCLTTNVGLTCPLLDVAVLLKLLTLYYRKRTLRTDP